jgi:hypothetical protein
MKAISRVLIAMVAAIAALFVSTGTSPQGWTMRMSLVDGQDRTMTISRGTPSSTVYSRWTATS